MSQDTAHADVSRRDFLEASATIAAVAALTGCSQFAGSNQQSGATAARATPQHGVFELSLQSTRAVRNPFWDLEAVAQFTAPSGRRYRVEGFYDGGNTWRVRFAPTEPGQWNYVASLRAPHETHADDSLVGEFLCEGAQGRGFLRISKQNPFRMEYSDGTPFYPIGVQTCNFLKPDFDGPNPDGTGRSVSNERWTTEFAGAVNLVRTQLGPATAAGCAFLLIPKDSPLDRYDLSVAQQLDEAFFVQRKAGISQILILFQDMSLWGGGKDMSRFGLSGGPQSYKRLGAPTLPEQEKYIRYVVARWASVVDIWEIFNEDSFAEADYLAHLAKLIRASDPYRRLITTNYAHPEQDWCEIVTFHEYMGMPANQVDTHLACLFANFKSHGKVVQNTEFGNQGSLSNVDPVKWRIATWTAFMHECGLLFWSMSQVKVESVKHGNANAYLGADSRQHFRVLNDFTHDLPIDMRPTSVGFTTHRDIRLYGLTNDRTSVVYVHHFADHSTTYTHSGPLCIWTGPGKFRLRWINPEDGTVIETLECDNPQHYLHFTLPPIKIDLACRIDRLA